MGSIYRRNGPDGKPRGPWLIAWVDSRGKQHIESTRIKGRSGTGYNHTTAKRLLAEREAAIAKGAKVTAKTGHRLFTDCLEDVARDQEVNERRDVRHTRSRITQHLAPFFDGYHVGEITTAIVRQYSSQRKAAGVAAATLNRELAIIRRAVRLAARNGDLATLPHVELVDESRNVREGIIEPRDFARVLEQLTPQVYADIAETASVTGWRTRSELLPLKWGQVDLKAGLLRMEVGKSKAGEGRTFPLTRALKRIMQRRKKASADTNPGTLVFTDDGAAISDSQFYDRWHPACEAAGVPGLIPHDLRRSAIREMERRRIPRQVAMRLVGHKTESVYRRYALVQEADIHEAGNRLDEPAPANVSTKRGRPNPRVQRISRK